MTVVCMDCKKTLGEKCSKCGAVAIELGDPLDSERRIVQVKYGSRALDKPLWICANGACPVTYFPEGLGNAARWRLSLETPWIASAASSRSDSAPARWTRLCGFAPIALASPLTSPKESAA